MYNTDYFAPDSWYEPDYAPETECSKCEENEKMIEISKNYLHSIIKMLYDESHLDIALLDDALGELCYQLDVDHPTKLPNITRPNFLKDWVESNNNYLKKTI